MPPKGYRPGRSNEVVEFSPLNISQRHVHFLRVTFAPSSQLRLPPPSSAQFLTHQPLGMDLIGFPQFRPVMVLSLFMHLRQLLPSGEQPGSRRVQMRIGFD